MTAHAALTRRALLSLRLADNDAGASGLREGNASAGVAHHNVFESDEAACALLSEARPFLAEEARRRGIDVAGRSELDVLKEAFAQADSPSG